MVSIQRDSHPRNNTYRHTAPTYEPQDDQYYRYGFPDCNNGEANAKTDARFDLCVRIASNRIKPPNQTDYLKNNDGSDYA